MDADLQQQALGRANAAMAMAFAMLNWVGEDPRLALLLETHLEHARASLLASKTPDVALSEFEKAATALLAALGPPKTQPVP